MKVRIIPGIKNNTISANDMRPLDFAIIKTQGNEYNGNLIMRTQSYEKKEWINLSRPTSCQNFIGGCSHDVELLPEGTIIQITI